MILGALGMSQGCYLRWCRCSGAVLFTKAAHIFSYYFLGITFTHDFITSLFNIAWRFFNRLGGHSLLMTL